jgi:hypothetical protein
VCVYVHTHTHALHYTPYTQIKQGSISEREYDMSGGMIVIGKRVSIRTRIYLCIHTHLYNILTHTPACMFILAILTHTHTGRIPYPKVALFLAQSQEETEERIELDLRLHVSVRGCSAV